MSSPDESPSPLVRFLDGFLQERNIKWVLTAGIAILLGSSLMMVTSHWGVLGNVWKYLILLAYVGVIHGAGQWSYHHFVLRKTGTMLMALTVLLIPLSFVAWHLFLWRNLPDGVGKFVGIGIATGLLELNLLLATLASRQIFRQLLCGSQPTFLICYLTLAVAGALAPIMSGLGMVASVMASLFLWAVFCAGAVKVNRHVFWQVEEHNAPGICGFLPILLLGGQFLGIFAANFAGQIMLPWMGLGLVLVAIPVLLTADAVADVFHQRTGALVRPLPWSIAVPVFTGTTLCAAGLGLAMTQLFAPPHAPYALVPTAALAAVVMAVVARRTHLAAFVWAMLAGVLLAYNFSPVFFQEIARYVLDVGAHAVREAKLPYAFYGLTYLPLIGAAMLSYRFAVRFGSDLFAVPLRHFSTALSTLLLVASFTHPDLTLYPAFLVGGVMTIVFALQTVLFADRRLALPSMVSWLIATSSCPSFITQVWGITLPAASPLIGAALGAAVLLAVGGWLDPKILQIGASEPLADDTTVHAVKKRKPLSASMCQVLSLIATVGAAATWLVRYSWPMADGLTDTGDGVWTAAGVIGVLLVIQALRWTDGSAKSVFAPRKHVFSRSEKRLSAEVILPSIPRWTATAVSAIAYGFAVVVALNVVVTWQISFSMAITAATVVLIGQWILDYVFTYWPASRPARAFRVVNRYTAYGGLAALLGAVFLPIFAFETVFPGWRSDISRVCFLFVTVWAFDAARRSRIAALTFAGCLGVLVLCSVLWLEASEQLGFGYPDASRWLPCLWAALACIAGPISWWLRVRLYDGPPSPSILQNLPVSTASEGHRTDLKTRSKHYDGLQAISRPLASMIRFVLLAVAAGSLLGLTWPLRVAGGVAVIGLLVLTVHQDKVWKTCALVIANWQLLVCLVTMILSEPEDGWLGLVNTGGDAVWLPVALTAMASCFAWQILWKGDGPIEDKIARTHQDACRALAVFGLVARLGFGGLSPLELVLCGATFALGFVSECRVAVTRADERRVWTAEGVVAAAIAYFAWFHAISFGRGICMFSVLFGGFVLFAISRYAATSQRWRVFAIPFYWTAMCLPMAAATIAVARHFYYLVSESDPAWFGVNSLAMLLAAGFYFWQGLEARETSPARHRCLLLLSASIVNAGLALLWIDLQVSDPQLIMIPIGASVLLLVELLRGDIPASMHDPLRYLGALIILVSPVFNIVDGSWIALLTLMVLSVAIMLVAIGIRVRALVYTGTAFLFADLVAMVVRGSIDHPNLLWLAGIGCGAAVLTLGAICENNRERVLQRMRALSSELESWN